jgi:hypothetical protein
MRNAIRQEVGKNSDEGKALMAELGRLKMKPQSRFPHQLDTAVLEGCKTGDQGLMNVWLTAFNKIQ